MKICSTCQDSLPLDKFPVNKSNKDGLNRKCRECYNSYMREWYSGNSEIHKERLKKSRNIPRDRARKYGLTVEQVDAMMKLHDGLCHLCQMNPATCIDHDHTNNNVRGVLCHGCNTGLGKLGDNVEGLRRAILYLSPHGPNGLTESIL